MIVTTNEQEIPKIIVKYPINDTDATIVRVLQSNATGINQYQYKFYITIDTVLSQEIEIGEIDVKVKNIPGTIKGESGFSKYNAVSTSEIQNPGAGQASLPDLISATTDIGIESVQNQNGVGVISSLKFDSSTSIDNSTLGVKKANQGNKRGNRRTVSKNKTIVLKKKSEIVNKFIFGEASKKKKLSLIPANIQISGQPATSLTGPSQTFGSFNTSKALAL